MKMIKSNAQVKELTIRSSTHRRYPGTTVKIRNNVHKFYEIGYSWRLCRTSRWDCTKISYRSGLETRSFHNRNEPEDKHNLTGIRLYGAKPYDGNEPRPKLRYHTFEDEIKIRKNSWPNPDHPNKREKYNVRYKYMMSGWHWIDERIRELGGFEGTIRDHIKSRINIQWIGDDKKLHKDSFIDCLCQLSDGLVGVWLPTAVLTRPVNKNTEGCKRALSIKRGKTIERSTINIFNVESDIGGNYIKDNDGDPSNEINIFEE